MPRQTLALSKRDGIFGTLLSPVKLGNCSLSHRVVLAPLTRCRAIDYVPQDAHVEYYVQRATPGGLLITEAIAVSQQGIGFPHSPGIWDEKQMEAWKKVVAAVHDKGGVIFCQLWHVGRASHTYYQPDGCAPVSSTAKRVPQEWSVRLPGGLMSRYSQPRALRADEILAIVEQFRAAAKNARRAGFDGVEVHGGHGYLLDQFFKDGINDRDDEYGGSIENRCRFGLAVLSAVAEEMGSDCTSIRLSPIIDHIGAFDSDPDALGRYLIRRLNNMKLAYLHITEPRFTSQGVKETSVDIGVFTQAYRGTVMRSGGFNRESGIEAIRSGEADLISYGRLFIANPDLPLRFALNAPLNEPDRSTFYTHDPAKGYLDYPFLNSRDVSRLGYNTITRSSCSVCSAVGCSSPRCGHIFSVASPRSSVVAAAPQF